MNAVSRRNSFRLLRRRGSGSLVFLLPLMALGILNARPAAAAVCDTTPTSSSLRAIFPTVDCDKCRGYALPGRLTPHPEMKYSIWSDLPEVFCSTGVLYATTAELPAAETGALPREMRLQTGDPDFRAIDDSFEVFLFHTIHHCKPASPARRIVIYVRNEGEGPVDLYPRQIISTEGRIGTEHQMESELGRRLVAGEWDTPIASARIEPGRGGIAAYSRRFGDSSNGPDSSSGQNCFGTARVRVVNPEASARPTRLHVFVMAIEAAPLEETLARAEAALAQGAVSGDTVVDMTTPPSGCQVRRATGVFPSFVWRNHPLTLDAAALPPQGLSFLMANWEQGSRGCPETRQTAFLLRHPPYTRPDSIGNYHVDNRLRLRLVNRDAQRPSFVDLRFGKHDADIGLAWRIATEAGEISDEALDQRPVRTGWAGPKQAALSRSFLAEDGGVIALAPCETREIALRLLVLGNSSLPYEIFVVPAGEEASAP